MAAREAAAKAAKSAIQALSWRSIVAKNNEIKSGGVMAWHVSETSWRGWRKAIAAWRISA